MQEFSGRRPSRFYAAAALLVALVAASCSGGERPTLTGDQLVEPNESTSAVQDPALNGSLVSPADQPATESTAAAVAARALGESIKGSAIAGAIEQLSVRILETLPHDPNAFTQGLELYDGLFVESTGLYGSSDLRRVVPSTGEVIDSVPVPEQFFAEGLTRVGDQLIQLTWRENTAFYWNASTFELNSQVSYQGEGWGLCHDGSRLIMTDGTPTLIFRDPATFDETSRIPVTLNDQPVLNLNEVECVNGVVWANIWQTGLLVRIDPASGHVTGVVDAIALTQDNAGQGDVLNGIAWDEATQSFYMTGKLWPSMYRVEFVAVP